MREPTISLSDMKIFLSDESETGHDFPIMLDCLEEHSFRAGPNRIVPEFPGIGHVAIYHELFKRLAVTGNSEDFADISLEMAISTDFQLIHGDWDKML